jgi:hypothetical protein
MSENPTHEIGIVHYPGVQVASIMGLTDLFDVASTITLDQWRSGLINGDLAKPRFALPTGSRDANLSCVYDSAPRGSPQPRTLIIPPTMVNANKLARIALTVLVQGRNYETRLEPIPA